MASFLVYRDSVLHEPHHQARIGKGIEHTLPSVRKVPPFRAGMSTPMAEAVFLRVRAHESGHLGRINPRKIFLLLGTGCRAYA